MIVEPFARLIRRGQASGDFDASLPVKWMIRPTISLGDAAGAAVASGGMRAEDASSYLKRGVFQIFGVQDCSTFVDG